MSYLIYYIKNSRKLVIHHGIDVVKSPATAAANLLTAEAKLVGAGDAQLAAVVGV